jgi:hypothetical protein
MQTSSTREKNILEMAILQEIHSNTGTDNHPAFQKIGAFRDI